MECIKHAHAQLLTIFSNNTGMRSFSSDHTLKHAEFGCSLRHWGEWRNGNYNEKKMETTILRQFLHEARLGTHCTSMAEFVHGVQTSSACTTDCHKPCTTASSQAQASTRTTYSGCLHAFNMYLQFRSGSRKHLVQACSWLQLQAEVLAPC